MNTTDRGSVEVTPPSLPTGGGAIKGMGEALGNVGMTGMASLTVPLPISPGRGYAPSLSLDYSSGNGNGAFALGWGLSQMTIRRRTSEGVPLYQEDDTYLSPDGEVLVPERDADGAVVTSQRSSYAGLELGQSYTVTRYFPSIEGPFNRIERWRPANSAGDFWLLRSPKGQLFCLGKSVQCRIVDPADARRIGVWLLEESVTPAGEHICYRYRGEDSELVDMSGAEAARTQTANRYLVQVEYGNVSGYEPLYAWGRHAQAPVWLFTLVLDYGERTLDPQVPPLWLPSLPWLCREDSFSDYSLGFEVRTHRLCRQVLMFHHFPLELGQTATLVARLLLGYQSSPVVSQLVSAQVMAYESDGKVQSLPPLDLSYGAFAPDFTQTHYEALPAFPALNGGPYQLVDLLGEGVPGVLYQHDNDWRYRAPVRGSHSLDAIDYAPWQPLPQLPSLQPARERRALLDLTGTGRFDLFIGRPGLVGDFTLNPDQRWSNFVPYAAFPAEFLQPSAQLADLVGAGLADLALIGPKSVRLYPNCREDGFEPGRNVPHDIPGDRLPLPSGDAASLVAFSDVQGSGQQHLVQVTFDQLTCWPNLGRGHFGRPLVLAALPFDQLTFNPSRVFLADLDGSGAADLIYAESDHFLIFFNESGNAFSSTPQVLPMPAGVHFDQLDQVSFADLDGNGVANLILSVSHIEPRHWCYRFAAMKPYLLESYNNNLGTHTDLTYRSSAQEWLDEKATSPAAACRLPFPIPVVSTIASLDEVSGNRLTQHYLYRHGVYAGIDREFRGFGFVQHLDTQHTAQATAQDVPATAPMLTKVWYNTGQEAETQALDAPSYEDPTVFRLGPPRFSMLNAVTGNDDELVAVDRQLRYQLHRALKGSIERQEVYGADSGAQREVPYSVHTARFQVRLLQAAASAQEACVALPLPLEQLAATYERVAADPVLQQQVTLRANAYGVPTWGVGIHYARKPRPGQNPYPDYVPDAMWASTYDEGQAPLRLTESRSSFYDLAAPDVWTLGLVYQQRQNVLTYAGMYDGYPQTPHGLSYETLTAPTGLLGPAQPRVLAGQAVTYYFDVAGRASLPGGTPPPPLALVHHVETAELDEQSLAAYDGMSGLDVAMALPEAGYLERTTVLDETGQLGATVWVIPRGYTTYVDAGGAWLPFYRPRATQSTPIVGSTAYTYDASTCVVTTVTDGAGNRMQLFYDYRFLRPCRLIDANDNTREVLLDALGRVVASTVYGSERDEAGQALQVGFSPLSQFNPNAPALASIEAAVANPAAAIQGAASVYLYDPYNWMGQLSDLPDSVDSALPGEAWSWSVLQQRHLLTFNRRPRSHAYRWARSGEDMDGVGPALREALNALVREPAQAATLRADRYPGTASAAQIMMELSYYDGFGRPLQVKRLCPPGLAYVVMPDGTLQMEDGKPVERDTGSAPRWAVSGRTEYDNKGQALRTYQPYFIDQPTYVNDTDARTWGYADTHYYDPLGREIAVVTALNYLRRVRFFPWFSMAEDENDTLEEVMTAGRSPATLLP
jgi:hypothetical protein